MKEIQHKLKNLIEDAPYQCPDCNIAVSQRRSFRKHVREHSSEKQYACAVCGFSSRHWRAIKKHTVLHTQKRYSCSKCSKTFRWFRSLKRHVISAHKGEKPFSCPLCTRTFGSSQCLTGHLRVHCDLMSTSILQSHKVMQRVNALDGLDGPLKVRSVRMNGCIVDELPSSGIDCCSIDNTCNFECDYCESFFSSHESLRTHCIEVHVYSKLQQSCVGCFSELIQLLMNHSCIHQTEIKEEPSTSFPDQTEDKSITAENFQNYGDIDDVRTVQDFSDTIGVKRKMRRQRVRPKIGINEYKCWHCNVIFKTLRTLREHRTNVHRNEKRFKCSICDKAYKRQDSLESHLRGHTGEKPYSCPECSKAFTMSSKLKLHMQTHSSSKLFLCKDCGKSLASLHTLRLHSRIHTGEKPFKCPLCDRTFPRSDAMKSHLRSHRSDQTTTEMVSQSTCSSGESEKLVPRGVETNKTMFKENSNRTAENYSTDCLDAMSAATSTTLDLTTVFRKRFMCSECGKQFFEHSMLVRHLRTHTGEKPFKCTDCSASFGDQGNLKRHRRQHTGEKPYNCSECSRQFSFSHSLKVHLLSHTRKKQRDKLNDVP